MKHQSEPSPKGLCPYMQYKLSRRGFLTGSAGVAALAGSGALLSGCPQPITPPPHAPKQERARAR